VRNSRNKDVFELISANHGMIVEDCSGGDVPTENIVSNIIEGLLFGFVLIHMEGVVDLCSKDALSPSLDSVDW
jgi:hypothetical protein